jgi:hypothetical protein
MPSADVEALVLAVNQSFYDAFARGDFASIEALWARHVPVSCIHPGWDALLTRDEVLASFRAIFRSATSGGPALRCVRPRAHVLGDSALVVCGESLDDNELIATNVFVLEDGQWKMAHHQAGPVHRPAEAKPKPRGGGMLN